MFTRHLNESANSRLVAIVGGSGSGKSWLAAQLQRALGESAGRISLDDFYRDQRHVAPELRMRNNFDHPRAIDWECVEEVLRDCKAGNLVRHPHYDYATHTRWTVWQTKKPEPVILVDGLWLLHRARLRELFDLSIYIDCPEQVRFERRLARDVAERGRTVASVCHQFRKNVVPMHDRFVSPQCSTADVVIKDPILVTEIQQLAERVRALLPTGVPLAALSREKYPIQVTTKL